MACRDRLLPASVEKPTLATPSFSNAYSIISSLASVLRPVR